MILDGLSPERVMKYFEDICTIPHGSGDTDRIAEYCMEFAAAHRLWAKRDAANNVIIKKPASPGCESRKTVMLQGHLDMVCAKENGCDIDFTADGLRLKHDGQYIWAEGTTLGGDDGIAVAMALAVLESDSIIHPALECVFTTDEEIGMLGASALDMSGLKADYLLNIDSEDEGIFTVSCAGGATLTAEFAGAGNNIRYGSVARITVSGLAGGHSGVEIDKGRANACIVLGKVLSALAEKTDIAVISINGGEKDNAIPRSAEAVIAADDINAVISETAVQNGLYKSEYALTDADITISAMPVRASAAPMVCGIIPALASVPNGVQTMSEDIKGLVKTSLNLGILHTENSRITAVFSIRSSDAAEKAALIKHVADICSAHGAAVSISGDYPAWEYKKDSVLRDTCIDVYTGQYGTAPQITAIHAGLECGIFSGKMPGIDCISFGPDIADIHTPKEKLDIASVGRVYNFLLKLLERL